MMRLELDTVIGDAGYIPQRKNLKPAGIGQGRFVPSVELRQPAALFDNFYAGTQIEMVGIPEDDLRADRVKIIGSERFD